MKKIARYLLVAIVFLMAFILMAMCSISMERNLIEDARYTILSYNAGSYKVYDNKTKVVYLYSSRTFEYSPVYDKDGKIMIYK